LRISTSSIELANREKQLLEAAGMTVTATLRRALAARLKGETMYAVAKGAGIAYDTLYRFANNPDQQLRSANIDALADYLGLELRTKDDSLSLNAAKRRRATRS
jgi:hypothetical protein